MKRFADIALHIIAILFLGLFVLCIGGFGCYEVLGVSRARALLEQIGIPFNNWQFLIASFVCLAVCGLALFLRDKLKKKG